MKAALKALAIALCVLAPLGTRDVLAADLKHHLIAAIDAPDGRSDGELSGRMAEFFKGADAVVCARCGFRSEH
jgi:hypothetical protein